MQRENEYFFPGKIVKELAKKEGNCRNSEGSFIKLTKIQLIQIALAIVSGICFAI